ncbi:MAG TPA: hypothetical protein VFS07_03160 [Gemmatimonadales bacterium]|jgi:hypothetical protein|nr:hypothetical protein [Gemmatimonadales bacterium]
MTERTRKTRDRIIEAAAEARDEALIEMGKAAEERQSVRQAKARRQTQMRAAAAVAATGAMLAAAALVRKRQRARKAPAVVPPGAAED